MAEAPDYVLQHFAGILNVVVDTLVVPLQALLNLVARLPKKLGGVRPITLTACIYRVVFRVWAAPLIDTWDKEYCGALLLAGDSAKKGARADDAAALRATRTEVAKRLKEFWIGIY